MLLIERYSKKLKYYFLHYVCFRYLDNNTPECISSCSCRTEAFNPVCGSDGVEYSSPCHAGCRNVTLETMEKTKEPKVLVSSAVSDTLVCLSILELGPNYFDSCSKG